MGDELMDVPAVDVFHDEIAIAGGDIEVIDGGNIWMREPSHGAGLGAETANGFAIPRGVGREDFDGHSAV